MARIGRRLYKSGSFDITPFDIMVFRHIQSSFKIRDIFIVIHYANWLASGLYRDLSNEKVEICKILYKLKNT